MKILAVSDQEIDGIRERVPAGGLGMIVGCGDLRYEYLEYMVTVLNVDLFYVPGNHDHEYNPGLAGGRAAGCTNLDLRTARVEGLLLAGFGGSIRYRPEGPNQYSQRQAFARALLLWPQLWSNKLRYGRALDILLTHSPPYGIHDDDSRSHQGLKAINWLIARAQPRYVLHGHMHYQQPDVARDAIWHGRTSIMNVFPYRLINVESVR